MTLTPRPLRRGSAHALTGLSVCGGRREGLNTIPLRKPSKEWFVKTIPDPQFHINTAVIELKEDNDLYLVDPSLWTALAGESTFGPRALITSINRQIVLFL